MQTISSSIWSFAPQFHFTKRLKVKSLTPPNVWRRDELNCQAFQENEFQQIGKINRFFFQFYDSFHFSLKYLTDEKVKDYRD